jgi:predicted ATP-binding protein involved in virulence
LILKDLNWHLYFERENRINGDEAMIIRSLHLENYRCFEKLDVAFDERLTVLVGVNGAGKTALLDALSVFLQQAKHPDHRGSNIYIIPVMDVTIGRKPDEIVYNLEVSQKNDIEDNSTHLSFVYAEASQSKILFYVQETQTYIDKMLDATNSVFVAYMAGRFVSEADSIVKQVDFSASSLSLAYENNFNRTIDYASTLSWFNNADADEARTMRDSGKKEELPELKAVRGALSKALLGQYERPRMLGNPPELIVYKKDTGIAFKVSQLSDGYRAMLALVMDLARRMAQVRGNGAKSDESILCTPAIVLIDEVELHLHPAWQQTVLNTLMDIFANAQFIVTTHSPQVLTSIPSRHIRILSDGIAYSVNEQTQGAEASRLLKHIFNVDQRPNGLEIVSVLTEYSKLVYSEKWDTWEAKKLREQLDEHYGKDEPKLMELDMHIENSMWERGL